MKSIILILSLSLLVCGGVSVADATPVNFKIGTANSIVYDTGKLDIDSEFSSDLVNKFFTLEEGGSFDFNYATINSIGVLFSQDTYSITANLSFILPEELVVGSDGTVKTIAVTGMCGKTSDEFWIDFDPVKDVKFDTDGLFTVELSDIYAYLGSSGDGCGSGTCYYPKTDYETITATVTLTKSPTAVPEPSTFILFGTILIGALGVKGIKR